MAQSQGSLVTCPWGLPEGQGQWEAPGSERSRGRAVLSSSHVRPCHGIYETPFLPRFPRLLPRLGAGSTWASDP